MTDQEIPTPRNGRMTMNTPINEDTVDPAAYGKALYDAAKRDPNIVLTVESLTEWFDTAIKAGRRSASCER